MLKYLSKVYGHGVYKPSIREVRIWFDILNHLIFKDDVKKFRYITLIYRRGQLGLCIGFEAEPRYCNLELNPRFRNFETFLKVLVHEMVHNYQAVNQKRTMSHGRYFYNWKKRVEKHGIPFEYRIYNRGGKECGLD